VLVRLLESQHGRGEQNKQDDHAGHPILAKHSGFEANQRPDTISCDY
jgi:hypothetical protein